MRYRSVNRLGIKKSSKFISDYNVESTITWREKTQYINNIIRHLMIENNIFKVHNLVNTKSNKSQAVKMKINSENIIFI